MVSRRNRKVGKNGHVERKVEPLSPSLDMPVHKVSNSCSYDTTVKGLAVGSFRQCQERSTMT